MTNSKKENNLKLILIKTLSLLLLFFLWELLSFFSDRSIFPSLIIILKTLLNEISEGELFFHLGMTMYRVLSSFLVAMAVGICIGILMGNNRKIDQFLDRF